MRYACFILIISLSCLTTGVVFSQNQLVSDTVRIEDVVIEGRPLLRSAGFMRTTISASVSDGYRNGTVSDILINASPLFIKSYGPGGIATVSFRGTNASHTVVTWNGISLNSSMLGQTDLFTIPALASDEISVYQGGSSVAVAHGGLGGVIDIVTKPGWNENSSAELSASAGGYGRISSSLKASYGKGSLRFSTRMIYSRAENNFSYVNSFLSSDPVREIRTNASALQKGILQEVWLKKSRSVSALRLWVHDYDRKLPVPVNVSPESHSERLTGTTLRFLLTHNQYLENLVISGVAAFIHDDMVYSDFVSGINSPSEFNRLTIRGSGLLGMGKRTSLKGEITSEFENVVSTNYEKKIVRNVSYISVAADHRLGSAADLNLNLVLPLVNGTAKGPDMSAGIELLPFRKLNWKIKSNVASKSRIPTMNDLYWMPGGNSLLKPERALSYELAVACDDTRSGHAVLSFRTALFVNHISRMIIWQPSGSTFWSPVNAGTIIARGAEGNASLLLKYAKSSIRMGSTYSYTRSSREGSANQLVYVPMHMANGTFDLSSGIVTTGFLVRHAGRRFITADNSQYLPAYTVSDVHVGVKTGISSGTLSMTLRFENLFNISYQAVAYHPMPPASVLLTANYAFRKVK
jgi:vitamin B12 transporter